MLGVRSRQLIVSADESEQFAGPLGGQPVRDHRPAAITVARALMRVKRPVYAGHQGGDVMPVVGLDEHLQLEHLGLRGQLGHLLSLDPFVAQLPTLSAVLCGDVVRAAPSSGGETRGQELDRAVPCLLCGAQVERVDVGVGESMAGVEIHV